MTTKYTQRIPFPHQSIGPFISCVRNYFNDYVVPFKFTVTGTYQKAIQLIEQRKQNINLTKIGSISPILVFTPTLTEPVPNVDFNWKYSNLHPYQVKWNQRPLIRYDDNILSIITRRMSGNVDFKIFCDSPMEAHDIYLNTIDAFRGLNKIMGLPRMTQYLVISDEIRLYEDDRKLSNNYKAIRWEDTTLDNTYFPGINKEKFYVPIRMIPPIMMTSLSDASVFYGGGDLPDYALQGTITFELEVPVLYTLETQAIIKHIDMDIHVSFGPNVLDFYQQEDKITSKLSCVEVFDTEGNTELKIIRVLDTYEVEIDVSNMLLEYPYIIPDIPWVVDKDNTLVYIGSELQIHWEADNNSIIMISGPIFENTTFDLRVLHYKSYR